MDKSYPVIVQNGYLVNHWKPFGRIASVDHSVVVFVVVVFVFVIVFVVIIVAFAVVLELLKWLLCIFKQLQTPTKVMTIFQSHFKTLFVTTVQLTIFVKKTYSRGHLLAFTILISQKLSLKNKSFLFLLCVDHLIHFCHLFCFRKFYGTTLA
jgi:hypothetical protein